MSKLHRRAAKKRPASHFRALVHEVAKGHDRAGRQYCVVCGALLVNDGDAIATPAGHRLRAGRLVTGFPAGPVVELELGGSPTVLLVGRVNRRRELAALTPKGWRRLPDATPRCTFDGRPEAAE